MLSMRAARMVAALLLAAACSASAPPLSDPILLDTPRPGYTDKTVRARIMMMIDGAETLRLDTNASLKIVEIVGDAVPKLTWFLSVSAGEPIPLEDGRLLLFTADLAPGLYEGPGTYTLQATTSEDAPGLESAAYVQFARTEPSPSISRFDRLTRPCTLEAAEQQRTGRIDCPELADAAGRTVRLLWRWELV